MAKNTTSKRATKKKVTKKKASKRSSSKALVSAADFKAQMRGHKDDFKREKASDSIRISTKDSRFAVGDTVIGPEMEVVIMDYAFVNQYFDRPWKEGENSPPACFAIHHDDEDELAPHPNSPAPQAETCAECDHNAWGSGVGNGKACSNTRRLVMLDADADAEPGAELATMAVAPTGIKFFKRLLKEADREYDLPVNALVVNMYFDDESPKVVSYDIVDELNDPALCTEVLERMDEAKQLVMQPIDCSAYEDPKKGSKRGGKSGSKASGKRGGSKATAKKKTPAKKSARRSRV